MTEDGLKYEITDQTHPEYPELHQIRALRTISGVTYGGALGGYVESDYNLSQDGTCWINSTSAVSGASTVTGDALVRDSSLVRGACTLTDKTQLDRAKLSGTVVLFGRVVVSDAQLHAAAGTAIRLGGQEYVSDKAVLRNQRDLLTAGPVGSENRQVYLFRRQEDYIVRAGCWSGTINRLRERVAGGAWMARGNANNDRFCREYLAICDLFEARVREWDLKPEVLETADKALAQLSS